MENRFLFYTQQARISTSITELKYKFLKFFKVGYVCSLENSKSLFYTFLSFKTKDRHLALYLLRKCLFTI